MSINARARPSALFRLMPLDARHACEALAEVADAAAVDPVLAGRLAPENPETEWLSVVFDLSPYLHNVARKCPHFLRAWLDGAPAERLSEIEATIRQLPFAYGASEPGMMRDLRLLRNEAHLLIALCDLSGLFAPSETVARLSGLAEAATAAAADFLLRDAHASGKLNLPDLAHPSEGSGWTVLGMGKLGGCELNFSSDIDLLVLFDPLAPAVIDRFEAAELFVRLTRRLVRILQDRTGEGYVFRTDLRLRPDPGSTPLAVPVEAALIYYEGRGQNWERAAMIKARPVAGDLAAGDRFLAELRPYVWRKYLDYAAIADIHSIKRQIHAHRGHSDIAVEGHNVKLGRGGIREIEFFVQTQQLIAGGRFPELRGRQTVPMLAELAARGWITEAARDTLSEHYWFLRRVEHAIQMIADEQSHTLPEDAEGVERVARLLGFKGRDDFAAIFRKVLAEVESHYAALFETAPQLSSGLGNLVFTGDVDDPDTLQTLSGLGFDRPSDIARVIRTWHFGRYKATQSAEARERLTELTPALLKAFGATGRADATAIAFDAFLAGLPAGIQLFSLLQSNQKLLQLLISMLSASPRLAAIITRRPHVFDGLLDPALLSELPDRAYLFKRLDALLSGQAIYEERLDRLRIFAAEQKFLIGMRLFTGSIDARRAGQAFSDLADLVVGAALEAVEEELARRHGRVPGGAVSVLAMGRLGSREMTAGSDLDLILLYDHPPEAVESDGPASLAPSHYYARLTQRLIAALSAPTAEGVLYEIDLRLRPSGTKGPVAVQFDAFSRYQRTEAWTWEHMALSRARPVAGDQAFCNRVAAEIDAVLALSRDSAKVLRDAAEMRAILAEEKPARNMWDVKLVQGGLVDLEFIAQTAVLTGSVVSEIRSTETGDILAGLAPDFVPVSVRDELLEAFRLQTSLTQMIRLCLPGSFDVEDVAPDLIQLLLRVTGLPDWSVLQAFLEEVEQRTAAHFDKLMKRARRPSRARRGEPAVE